MELNRRIIDQTIFYLFGGTAKYKRSFNYDELVEGWEDDRPVPEKQTIVDKWNELESKKELKHPEYYKLSNKKWVLDQTKKADLKAAIKLVYDKNTGTDFAQKFVDLSLAIEESETEAEFLTTLFTGLKSDAITNNGKKNALNGKTMAELINLYNIK